MGGWEAGGGRKSVREPREGSPRAARANTDITCRVVDQRFVGATGRGITGDASEAAGANIPIEFGEVPLSHERRRHGKVLGRTASARVKLVIREEEEKFVRGVRHLTTKRDRKFVLVLCG